ncbi:MAG: IS630 family transposase [Myxococcales bacterium]|nr:IS630 family transposase [Myxococcales bacterium]
MRLSKHHSKKISEHVKKCLPDDIDLNAVEIWFQDEARVGQQGSITRMWAEKGTRPRALRQLQYDYAYIFGAVCPARDVAVGLVVPDIGTDGMIAHLNEISKSIPTGKIAVIVLDRASWHTTKKLNIFSNIKLLSLPPASPELNPVEQLWQQLRNNSLANRAFKDYSDIESSCCDAWNEYVDRKGAITSLCSRDWANLKNENLNG